MKNGTWSMAVAGTATVVFMLAASAAQARSHEAHQWNPPSGEATMIIKDNTNREQLNRLSQVFRSHLDASSTAGKTVTTARAGGWTGGTQVPICLSAYIQEKGDTYATYSISYNEAALSIRGPLLYETCHDTMRFLPEIKGVVDFQIALEELKSRGFVLVKDKQGSIVLGDVITQNSLPGNLSPDEQVAAATVDETTVRKAMSAAYEANSNKLAAQAAMEMMSQMKDALQDGSSLEKN